MAKWKLVRQIFGHDEFLITEGEDVTIGRGISNKIILSSAVISRNHCVINIQNSTAYITDLKSSNGVYVGKVKIPQNKPFIIQDSNFIGLGWTVGAPLTNIEDSEKYIFKLVKQDSRYSLTNRLIFQNDTDTIESKVAVLDSSGPITQVPKSPVLNTKLSLKRKAEPDVHIKKEIVNCEVVNISDSDNDIQIISTESELKKPKPAIVATETPKEAISNHYKDDNIIKRDEVLQYEAFKVKQEYMGYDDEPIQINSDSDSESEQWLMRLSQSSPGKPFIKIAKQIKTEVNHEESSYSQLDDIICNEFVANEEEEFMDDIISFPDPPDKSSINIEKLEVGDKQVVKNLQDDDEDFFDDIISFQKPPSPVKETEEKDVVDGFTSEKVLTEPESLLRSPISDVSKKIQIIEPLAKVSRRKSVAVPSPSKPLHKHSKVEKKSSKKRISDSQKEERKKKLKEIATKDLVSEQKQKDNANSSSSKATANVKVTATNRGAFLTDVAQAIVKPVKQRDRSKVSEKSSESSSKHNDDKAKDSKDKESKHRENKEKEAHHTDTKHKDSKDKKSKDKDVKNAINDIENKRKEKDKSDKAKHKKSKHTSHSRRESTTELNKTKTVTEQRKPLQSIKPLTSGENCFSGKPVSKVGPLVAEKPKKKVRFSEDAPKVFEFQIEPGNKMKKTSSVKTTLVDVRQTSLFSLEKITLMKILRWNPQWLDEQVNNNDPPPILGHNNMPMTIFHSFSNHHQYVQLIGDLLLMEIWECLTIAYMKMRSANLGIQMRIESLPPVPSNDRCFDLFNFSVNVSLPSSEARNVPRVGEILLVTFGPDNAKNSRFFFVNNVRNLPSPPHNIHSFFSISLQATFTDKMKTLRPGELMIGKSLAYINKELMLFEAMEYLAGSPLSDAILRPEPQHFLQKDNHHKFDLKTQWTNTLNPSQLSAVSASVSAALSDRPRIQMVQGPPGTGKSSVICAIVMTYFYNAQGKKQQNRGKILICATSNAAVDGLVIRLLNLRQKLPKPERFRMVRVGRAEAMHPVAANISSQQLAHRDLTRPNEQPAAPAGFDEEILHLEAKINMWKTAAQETQDTVRVAYCQGRVSDLIKRITLLKSGVSRPTTGDVRPEQLAQAERRIIEGADIVVTTLASAQNNKMRGLKRRIALCIIDEAGQAIEPETLIPLTLDVTRLTLIGDPQQLPGYICSQRAKKHGLSESLFSRLTSCTEQWPGGSPVILLNKQYRMHPDIADYPSRAFYGGLIQSVSPSRPELNIPPYSIVTISSGDKGQGTGGANEMEAWGVSRLVMALDALTRPLNLKLAVITPYNAHKDLIKKNLRMLQSGDSRCEVEVNTIDSFQGQERDVVVVSLARSQGVGFLTDAGRMNVMLTRARHALLVCLNPHALLKNHQWRTLVEDAQRRNFYKVLPNKMCQPTTASDISNDDILKYINDKRSHHHSRR